MKPYNRDDMNEGRKKLGALLHLAEGRVYSNGSGIDASIEFRTHGLLFYSMRNNASDVISFNEIHQVGMDAGTDLAGTSARNRIVLLLKRDNREQQVFLELEHPEFIAQGLEKAVRDVQEKAAKKQNRGYGDVLRDLNQLFQEGLVTEAEYQEKKAAILKRMVE